MTLAYRNEELIRMVDASKGEVDRRMFFDEDIYQLELERIFARAWNFMAHDSQIPNPGDFFMTFIGEDRVIVVRDNDGLPQVLVNSCRHRGNAVCRAEEGHASSFMCTYHGWTYDLKGNLVGVPGFKEVYHEELDRENWGLIKAAQVDTYKGFIFACMDAEAPGLDEYLGRRRPPGSRATSPSAASCSVVPGIQKYTIPCNWKLAVDNLFDWYHVGISHGARDHVASRRTRLGRRQASPASSTATTSSCSASMATRSAAPSTPRSTSSAAPSAACWTSPGASGRKSSKRWARSPSRSIGHPSIFPNLWVTEANQLSLRLPKGPHQTEIWWFTLLEEMEPDTYKQRVSRANHIFGPAGSLEQEDGENWGESTRGTRGVVSRRYPLNYAHEPRPWRGPA